MSIRDFFRKRTEEEKQRILMEAFNSEKITLVCKKHMYAGKGMPTDGCVDCSQVWWTNWAAKLDPAKRTEIIEYVHGLAHKAVELESKGQFDIKLDRHPEFTIEKGKEN
jgi:hypothetical protein